MTKHKKVVWYECHNCKLKFELPGYLFHAEDGTIVCRECGKGLIRHVKKVEIKKEPVMLTTPFYVDD